MRTEGYPYFIQEWGKHAWREAKGSPITQSDAEQASQMAIAELDDSFFRVRFDRLTPVEKRYVRAMAELGPGLHRSKEVAQVLQNQSSEIASVRDRLVKKGVVYSPAHGDVAFTVPLFDGFLKRVMPVHQHAEI